VKIEVLLIEEESDNYGDPEICFHKKDNFGKMYKYKRGILITKGS